MTDQKMCKEWKKAAKAYNDPKACYHKRMNIAVKFFEDFAKEMV